MRRLAPSVIAGVLIAAGLIAPAGAAADVYGPIELVSQGALQGAEAGMTLQANYAHDPTISLNGRYVAFDGSYAGRTGVWRRNLENEEIAPVAVGAPGATAGECQASPSGAPSPCDAVLPSISANGQYVSFTTAAPLAPHEDVNDQPDVYVRNMDVQGTESNAESAACVTSEEEASSELTQRCPFTLVSAVDGKDEGLSYGAEAGRGSLAEGRSAISANGQKVAFVTSAASNLAGPGTPAMQVAVRDLATSETELVSTRYDPETGQAIPGDPVSGEEGEKRYGGAYDLGAPPRFPIVPGGHTLTQPVGASISADGSTVAWLGADIGEQARALSGERFIPAYAEPLWRRIEEGPHTPTRRITGGSDPEDPACAASGEQTLPETASASDPCQGPFVTNPLNAEEDIWGEGESVSDFVPQLSADGYQVAFLSSAPLLSLGNDFGLGDKPRHADVYVADMQPGLSRTQALRPLTELASGDEKDQATNAPVVDLAISPDGTQVAFTTRRTEFLLAAPAFVSPPAAIPGLDEVLVADLTDETLTRVTQGFEGGASAHPHPGSLSDEDPYEIPDDGALSPSFSEDGNTLAFSSTASNLVYGDGNTPAGTGEGTFDGADTFVVTREVFAPTPTPQEISSPPPPPTPSGVSWMMGASALSLPNGTVRVYVSVPGRGALNARAQDSVLVRRVHLARRARKGRRTPGRSAASRRAGEMLVERSVATAAKRAEAEEGELVTLTLRPSSSLRALAFKHGGLSATLTITFTAAGHVALHQSLDVSFVGVTATKARASTHSRRTVPSSRAVQR
jgi:hypothetical protein